ncbi:MAG: hypothetical protein HY293_20500 [Planctomycetes bacterium]|nr:hypothetical protein [Planctomycetota bacterium]
MKTFLTAAILGLTGLAGAAGADAQDHRDSRHERSIPVRHHRRHRETRMERVWVPARSETRVVGTDSCGKPITRRVSISEGYWTMRAVRCD